MENQKKTNKKPNNVYLSFIIVTWLTVNQLKTNIAEE